jgi:membrane protein implicated in regulation of membrane protease activity
VTFVTTEHFTLQGERSRAISELTARTSIFLATVSGALVGLGLMATATHVGTAFYAFALILLPTLSFVGLVTFERTLRTTAEDHYNAHRIARLRSYYFRHAPELTDYLLSVSPEKRLVVQGLATGSWQALLTIPGMVAVITGVLVGATAGTLVAVVSDHSLTAALAIGCVAAVATIWGLWRRGQAERKQQTSTEELSPYA